MKWILSSINYLKGKTGLDIFFTLPTRTKSSNPRASNLQDKNIWCFFFPNNQPMGLSLSAQIKVGPILLHSTHAHILDFDSPLDIMWYHLWLCTTTRLPKTSLITIIKRIFLPLHLIKEELMLKLLPTHSIIFFHTIYIQFNAWRLRED